MSVPSLWRRRQEAAPVAVFIANVRGVIRNRRALVQRKRRHNQLHARGFQHVAAFAGAEVGIDDVQIHDGAGTFLGFFQSKIQRQFTFSAAEERGKTKIHRALGRTADLSEKLYASPADTQVFDGRRIGA